MKTMVYKSKFGVGVVGFSTLIFAIILAFMLIQGEPTAAILSVALVFVLVEAFIVYLNFATKYIVSADGFLNVRMGLLINTVIDIREIKSIAKTNSLLSSPAPSMDRIIITYGKSSALILSPKDKVGFAQELEKVNPAIDNQLHIQETTQQFPA